MDKQVQNNSVVKAFTLLEHFTPQKQIWGVRELAAALDANQSTTYRLMATLESLGVLKQNEETNKYSLGLKLYALGKRVDIYSSLVQHTHSELIKVSNEITETVHLGIFKDHQVFMLDKVESPRGLKLNSVIGSYSPAYCTGLGKVLLSNLTKEQLADYLKEIKLVKFTDHTITQKNELIKALSKIREDQFVIDNQEKEYGLICVAVPVYNADKELIASLSAAGPAQRFKPDMLESYINILKKGADAIGQNIGNFNPNK